MRSINLRKEIRMVDGFCECKLSYFSDGSIKEEYYCNGVIVNDLYIRKLYNQHFVKFLEFAHEQIN